MHHDLPLSCLTGIWFSMSEVRILFDALKWKRLADICCKPFLCRLDAVACLESLRYIEI